VWNTFFRKGETPRELQERNDLYMSILSLRHRQLRMERNDDSSDRSESREQIEALVDAAVAELEDEMVAHKKSVVRLRYDQQNFLAPQLTHTLRAFQDVDAKLPASASDEEMVEIGAEDEATYKMVLLNEYEHVLSSLETNGGKNSSGTSAESRLSPYLLTKRSALETILSFKKWIDEENASSFKNTVLGDFVAQHESDAFGYCVQNENTDMGEAVRHHQMINLARAAFLREKLGFSVLSLRSTIPGAGRGVFLDGAAKAGSLVAFFPGYVWPKEHLTNKVLDSSLFQTDPKLQLSIRYDDMLIDARKAPYTVLNRKKANPFAIAHIANHVPEGMKSNCSTVAINFTSKLGLKKAGLMRYVPNAYARLPMITGQQALDRDAIDMHGFALLASRDLKNEELMYDYRLSPGPDGSYPDWYHPCDIEAARNRWWQEKLM